MNPSEIRVDHFLRFCLLSAIVYLLISSVFFKRGWLDWHRIVKQNQQLSGNIDLLEKRNQELESNIALLARDPRKQELLVREVLGYVRPDETVIEFD